MIPYLAILVEHRLVTDSHGHRQTQARSIYRASISSRGKNWLFSALVLLLQGVLQNEHEALRIETTTEQINVDLLISTVWQ